MILREAGMESKRARKKNRSTGKGSANDRICSASLEKATRRAWFSRLLGGVAVVFPLVAIAHGQSTTGSIFGTVTDQSGGVLASSTVTATDLKTGIVRTVQTNASGNYVFPSLPPGDYAISAA